MPLDPQQRSEFVDAYTRLLITTWSSEEFSARIDTDLHGALAEVGISVPQSATVERIREVPEARNPGGLNVQIEAWERGLETNHYYFYIPDTPQIDVAELSEGDLEGVAASTYVCCCCCPCCSC